MSERNSTNYAWVRARGEWLGRYRMCVAVDRVNSDPERPGFADFAVERAAYRWRAVAGLAAAYERFPDSDPPPASGSMGLEAHGLTQDAIAWLLEASYVKLFSQLTEPA